MSRPQNKVSPSGHYLDVLTHHVLASTSGSIPILFFGASVTEQRAGYVLGFQEELTRSNKSEHYIVVQKGIGAVHLREACLLIPKVLETTQVQHGVCMLEWLTTSPTFTREQVERYLTYIIKQLRQRHLIPMFLLLYNNELLTERKEMMEIWMQYAHQYRIPTVNMFDFGQDVYKSTSTSVYFKDQTHLTGEGGTLFGSTLFQVLKESLLTIPVPTICHDTYHNYNVSQLVTERMTPTIDVKTSLGSLNVMTLTLGDCISLPRQEVSAEAMYALWVIVGPESGVIEIHNKTTDDREWLCLWDQWCCYNRFMIRMLASPEKFKIKDGITIALCENKDPPYHLCKKISTFCAPEKRIFQLHCISTISIVA